MLFDIFLSAGNLAYMLGNRKKLYIYVCDIYNNYIGVKIWYIDRIDA